MSFDQIALIVSAVGNAVTAISAVVVAIAAWLGLRAWRRELIGKGRYESARRLLLLARRFRAAFARSRGPLTFSNEYRDRPREENESPERTQILDEEYARRARLQPAADLLIELEQAAWEAEIVTGEKIVPIVQPFGEVIHALSMAIYQHFTSRLRMTELQPGTAVNPAYAQQHDKAEMIYQLEPDELNKRVDDALAELEKRLKKYIR